MKSFVVGLAAALFIALFILLCYVMLVLASTSPLIFCALLIAVSGGIGIGFIDWRTSK